MRTDEQKSQIIEAYKRGDKTVVIEKEFGIGPAEVYRLLRQAKVPLRSQDPNHPASSMEVRHEARISTKAPSKKLNMTAARKLIQLSHDEVAYFKQILDDFVKEYTSASQLANDDIIGDSWIEAWSEYDSSLDKRLDHWLTELGTDAGGIVLGIEAFKEALKRIYQLQPEHWREEVKQ